MRVEDSAAPTPSDAQTTRKNAVDVSIIVPVYNEEGNLPTLVGKLFAVIRDHAWSAEVIAVNDGSGDRSAEILDALAAENADLKIVHFRRNFGQTAALMAGIDHARGAALVFIDADLQNDPADIPKLLAKLDEGYDVVSGWRAQRQDAALSRNLPSRLANRLISWIGGVPLHDYGCTLKAYRRDVLAGSRLYGEMHRFIPIYATWMGARVAEIPVAHYPRVSGKSNYGLERVIKVVLDLLVVKFFDSYMTKPIYFFGGFGLACMVLGVVAAGASIWLKLFHGISMIQTPLLLLATVTFLTGFLSLLIGLLAEIMIRVYFESRGKTAYAVRSLRNIPHTA